MKSRSDKELTQIRILAKSAADNLREYRKRKAERDTHETGSMLWLYKNEGVQYYFGVYVAYMCAAKLVASI